MPPPAVSSSPPDTSWYLQGRGGVLCAAWERSNPKLGSLTCTSVLASRKCSFLESSDHSCEACEGKSSSSLQAL